MAVFKGSPDADVFAGDAADDEAKGYAGNDHLSGGSGDDVLEGGAGNDTLRGDAGDDTLSGDAGDDTLYGGEGNDRLFATFWQSSSLNVGNDVGSTNLLYGEAGDDELTAGVGRDVLEGGIGNDFLYSMDDDAALGGDILRGGDGDDLISANGDWVEGGSGDDHIRVAAGSGSSGSSVSGGGGADLIEIAVSSNFSQNSFSRITDFDATSGDRLLLNFSLPLVLRGELDNPAFSLSEGLSFSSTDYGPGFIQIWTWKDNGLTYLIVDLDEDGHLGAGDFVLTFDGDVELTADVFYLRSLSIPHVGTEADDVFVGTNVRDEYAGVNGDDTISGGTGADWLQGNNGNDVINGGADNDTLWGGRGDDTLYGGTGDDFIRGDGGSDTIYGGGGNDTIITGGDHPADVEDVNAANIVYGDAGHDQITGGFSLHDELHGGDGSDVIYGIGLLFGDAGDDLLSSGIGPSTLDGGSGDDTLRGGRAVDVLIGGDGDDYLHGGLGNDELRGGSGDDILSGYYGDDTLTGGAGADLYYVDSDGDAVIEANEIGVDTVVAAITYALGTNVENLLLSGGGAINGTGNSLGNTLTGNAANNVLDGRAGADRMEGLGGADTYYVDDAADVVVETNVAGTDRVSSSISYVLGANVENLSFSGSADINGRGNALKNALVGNAGANVLNGAAGADTMTGKAGNDSYYVDNVGDVVVESSVSDGTDSVFTTIGYVLGDHVENLNLLGTAALNGRGNALANLINGNGAANVLNGMGGADTMNGLSGDDTYYVDNVGDVVFELNAAGGTDQVYSTISHVMGSYIENLTLTGSAAINATGNGLANTIIGNAGANVITGGAGADALRGGAGADRFVYASVADSRGTTFDRITDLSSSDRIDLSAIDANTGVAGNQAFSIIDAFTKTAGQMTLDYSSSTKLTTILMDVNGDGVADMKIVANGNHEAFNNFVF